MRRNTDEPNHESLGGGDRKKEIRGAVSHKETFGKGSIVVDEEQEKQKKTEQIKVKEKMLEENFFERGDKKKTKDELKMESEMEAITEGEEIAAELRKPMPPLKKLPREQDEIARFQKASILTPERQHEQKVKKMKERRAVEAEKEDQAILEANIEKFPSNERRTARLKAVKEQDEQVFQKAYGSDWVQKLEEQGLDRTRRNIEKTQTPSVRPSAPTPPPPQPEKKQGFFGKIWSGMNNLFNQ